MASTNQAQWSNVPNVAQLTSGLQAEEPTVPTASEGVLLQPDAVRQQVMAFGHMQAGQVHTGQQVHGLYSSVLALCNHNC